MPDAATDNPLYNDAMIYDILHTPGTAEELDALERVAAAAVRTRSRRQRWLEPACGSGRCVRLAAARGTPTLGFDLNPAMIDYARRRIRDVGLEPLARVETADMRTFADDALCAPASIDFAFNTINTFRHLMTDDDALAHLEQVHRTLKPGGAYAVGLSTCLYAHEPITEDIWGASRGRVSVLQTVQYIPPTGPRGGSRVERVFSHVEVTLPSRVEHGDSTYALRTYSLNQWLGLITKSPFEITAVTDHTGRDADLTESGYRLFVLGKATHTR